MYEKIFFSAPTVGISDGGARCFCTNRYRCCDERGWTFTGATIIIKGTTQGTTSDFDGNFSINADADADYSFYQ
jgi:hypothetical protein